MSIVEKESIIVLYSYHHNNTRKVAETIAKVINASIKSPIEIKKEELNAYDLIGFGSGIDSGKHYKELLDFVETLPIVNNKKCYIFSTSAVQGEKKVFNDHTILRKTLLLKGYKVIGEFSCKGFNTNSFLKYFGGMNKNNPNAEDIQNAEKFAYEILSKV